MSDHASWILLPRSRKALDSTVVARAAKDAIAQLALCLASITNEVLLHTDDLRCL